METLITILWVIGYFFVGFIVSTTARIFDSNPSKDDQSFYTGVIFLWWLYLILTMCVKSVEGIGKATGAVAEAIKPGCTVPKPKEDQPQTKQKEEVL
jgi:hypothetical protein